MDIDGLFDRVSVELGDRSYDILVGNGLLSGAGDLFTRVLPLPRVFIVTDEQVAQYHLSVLEESLRVAGVEFEAIILPHGEHIKRFDVLESVVNEVLSHRPERQVSLVALGGGVVGDLTGFVASILLRGVNFVQIPTTLLAQVDSSVGGKTGINTSHGKNLVGSFYQPKLVLADMELLETLPKRELLAGYAEVVKYGLIQDATFFDWLVSQGDAILSRNVSFLSRCVVTSCQAKADIVARDEREGGVRALLNLGHTFGHALEAVLGYDGRLLHGEAVAIGMVMAFGFSHHLSYCSEEAVLQVKGYLQQVGLPVSPLDVLPDWDVEALLQAMYQDKKVSDGKLVFILVRDIGDAFVARDIEAEQVRVFIENVLQG